MATQEEIKAIAGLYVAYFNRAPDPAGLTFWIQQLDNGRDFATISQDFADSPEAKEIFPFLATPEISALDPANLVTSIFNNMFDRDPDAAGLAFWVDVVESGAVAVGDMVEAIMMGAQDTIVNGELIQDHTTVENKIECALEFTVTASSIPGYDFDTEAYQAARASIDNVDATQESVDAAKFATANYFGGEYTNANNLFTLCEHRILVSEKVVEETLVTNTVLYWGYNPHSHDETDGVDNLDGNDPNGNDNNLTNEGPEDGGVPLVALFDYFQAIAGVDLQELAEIDTDNGDFPDLSNVTSITLLANGNQVDPSAGSPNNGDNDSSTNVDANTGGGTLTLTYDDFEADIALGQAYFDLLHDLIFDEEGNSRLFEKEVAADVPVYLDEDGNLTFDPNEADGDAIGRVDAVLTETTDAVYATIPPILTPVFNNGGTFEQGFTSEADDLIVAGRLELLHGAVIDGGLGYNTLEVDAKGVFAQAKSLVNIQHISIQNLPNIYTDEDIPYINDENEAFDLFAGNIYPNLNTGSAYDDNSTIDISRAVDLELVTITEGIFESLSESQSYPDELTVAGIRNGATVVLDGGFDQDVYVYWRDSTGPDGLHYVLNNVSADNTMYLTEAATKVTFESIGGGNYISTLDENNNSAIREMVITGDAHLFIESDLEDIFDSDTPALIDASANTGGVDLNADGMEIVTFIGSKSDDRFAMDTSASTSTNQGLDFADDQRVTIVNELGNNYYDIETEHLEATDGDGNNNFEIHVDDRAIITAGNGHNVVQGEVGHLTLTLGDGDNRIDINLDDADSSRVSANSAGNDFGSGGQSIFDIVETGADIVLGEGSNYVVITTEDDLSQSSSGYSISNEIDFPEINITAGNGGNTILLPGLPIDGSSSENDYEALTKVNITTGTGADFILVAASEATISSNGGGDEITLLGVDDDYVTEVYSSGSGGSSGSSGDQYGFGAQPDTFYNYKGFIPSIYGIQFDVDTGPGSATINLGAYSESLSEVTGAMVAKEGSSITGEDITIFVNTDADLRAASLTGITAVVMDDDNRLYSGQGYSNGDTSASGAASLTLLDSQVAQLLADGVAFSTQGQTFGAQSVLTIVITGDVVLSDLIDLASWNDSVKLCFVVEDGASLTLSAEELHKYVAPEGIAVDEINGYVDNQVIVTDAGFGFDPFNDQNQGTGGGTISGELFNQDIDIIYVADGYERPAQDTSTATIAVNSDDTPVVEDIVSPFAKDLVITGDADLQITGKVDLADDFTIDFTDFNGDFPENADGVEVAMTIYNFQEITGDVNDDWGSGGANSGSTADDGINPYSWGRIDGNGTTDDPVRINVVMQPDTSAGDCDWGVAKGGIFSTGVQQYILTGYVDAGDYDIPQATGAFSTIVVCDHTEDLEVLGLQNNRNGGVTFEQVNWGTEILMEGDGYANASDQEKNLGDPDLSEVGCVTANFFESGANAFVRITNQGTELGLNEDAEDGYDPDGERKLVVAGVVVNNADRLRIDVEDGDAIVEDVSGVDVERVIVNGPEDVELRIDCVADLDIAPDLKGNEFGGKNDGLDSKDLKSIDGSGVAGEFKLTFDGSGEPAHMGGSMMTNGSGWAVDDSNYKIVDLSNVVLTGVDAIELAGDYVKLIMTADQLVAFGGIIETTGDNSRLDVTDLSDQALDLTTIDVDTIGTVSLAEGTYTVDPAVDFGDADMLVMVADGDDLTVTMTLDQLQTVSGDSTLSTTNGPINSAPNVCFDEDNGGDAKLILTGVEGDDQIDTSNFVKGPNGGVLDVEIRGGDFVGTEDFAILPDDGVNTGDPSDMVFIHVILDGGVNDVTDVPPAQLLGLDCLTLEGGAVLNITAVQLAVLMSKDPQEIKVADGETATINIVDLYDDVLTDTSATKFDLNALVAANPGLDIGTISIRDTNTGENEDFTGVDGMGMPFFTFGGADEIITPTGSASSPEFGVESTQLTITASQFLDLDGIGFISGGSVVNIESLANTIDGGDSGADPDSLGVDKPDTDTVEIDTSGITARKGTMTLIEVGATTDNGEAVFLTDTSDISGFEIILTDGQLIGFATEAQASGATVTEMLTASGNPTGIVWCFQTWSGNAIDTSNYDSDINTLFVYDTLVDGQNEEAIWTYLASSIEVQKFNDAIPIGLAVINRVNIFEPFTTAPNGITFDDTDGLQTIGQLTLILEGNVLLGDVTIADTVGDGDFEGITINSTFDNENNPGDSNVIIQENEVGDIVLNAPMAANTILEVLLNASDDQTDASFANGTTGAGSGADTDAGNDLVTGTIFLGTPAAGVNAAVVDVENDDGATAGADITIGGIDYSNAFLTRVDVETDGFNFLPAATAPDLTIGGLNIGDLSTTMGLSGDPDKYLILNNFTATSTTDLNDILSSGTAVGGSTEIIMATDGDVDLKAMGSTGAVFDVDGVYATSPGTLNLTGDQLAAITIIDTVGGADGIADNWVLGPGVNPGDVTINICDLDTTTAVNLNAIAAAGFNIGTITVTVDQELHPGTTLGGADEIVIELGNTADTTISLEMTAAQFKGFSGVISETLVPMPVNPTGDYEGQVIVDELEAVEEGTVTPMVDIDFSQVTTTGDNAVMLSNNGGTPNPDTDPSMVDVGTLEPDSGPVSGGDGDVILTDTSILGNFAVVLNDVGVITSTPANELAGHTIRFSTVEQADGRTVLVFEPDPATPTPDGEQDTNVVWLFDTLGGAGSPGLDVSGYAATLGRIWVSDDLVETMAGNNIELLFTIDNPDDPGVPLFTLEEGIIKRIESGDLTDALAVAQPYAQTIEIVSGTGLAGLMAEITDPIIFLEQLTIDLGGVTSNGDLEIDNLLGISILGDDDFKELTLNSFIGDFYTDANTKHYLLPDDFTIPPGALPSDALQFPSPANVFGDILSGGDRGVLRDITINTGVGEYAVDVTSADTDASADGDETVTVSWTLNGVAQTPLVVSLSDSTDPNAIAADIAAGINTLPSSFGIVAQANGPRIIVNDNGTDVFAATGVVAAGTQVGIAVAPAADPVGERGTAFEAQTIFFSEDDTPEVGKAGAAGVSDLEINGVHDVTVKGLDTTDAEIIVANLDFAGHTGTFTATGGSAAFTGGSTTEKLIIGNGSGAVGTALFGGQNGDNPATAFTQETDFFVPTEVGGQVQAGIDGVELSKIDTTGHGGTVNLGIVSQIDGTGLNSATTAGFDPAETFNGGFNDGFILDNSGAAGGLTILCLGAAETTADGVVTPTLSAGGEWTFIGPMVQLEMKEVVLEGTLNLTDVDLCITGDVDFTDLEALVIMGATTIEVKGKLTLTVEQVDDLEDAGVVIFGEGAVCVEGESDSTDGDFDTTFGAVIQTATMDLSAVTLDAGDPTLDISVAGAMSDTGGTPLVVDGDRVAQTVIGSANDDLVTILATAGDADAMTIDVITQLGADGGDIGDPNLTNGNPFVLTDDTDVTEVYGDIILTSAAVQIQVEADAGYDAVGGFMTGDITVVGSELYSEIFGDFVATADTTNDGIAVLEAGGTSPQTIDVSAAGGASGFVLVGAADPHMTTLIGSDQDDTIIDGMAELTGVPATEGDNDTEEDTFTLNDGADTVIFNVARSAVATFTTSVEQVGQDLEEMTVGAPYGAGATVQLFFDIGGTSPAVIEVTDGVGGADLQTSVDTVATAVANAINARGDAFASTTAGGIIVAGALDAGRFALTGGADAANFPVTDGLADVGFYGDDPADGDDDRSESVLTIAGAVTLGEVYTVTIMRGDGTSYEGVHTVDAADIGSADPTQSVLDDLATSLNTNAAGSQLFYTVNVGGAIPVAPNAPQSGAPAALEILALDTDMEVSGGFSITAAGGVSTVVSLSSSSVIVGGETALALVDADVITDFVSADDSIDFLDLPAGTTPGAYAEGAAPVSDDFAGALADANAALGGGATYYMTSTTADGGILFYDANGDGDADGVVSLPGVDATTFGADDII